MSLAVLPRMLERDRGVIVNVSTPGRSRSASSRRRRTRRRSSRCAAGPSRWRSTSGRRASRCASSSPAPIDTEIWDQPGNDPAHYDGPLEPPSVGGRRRSSTRSRATASSATCPTSRSSSSSRRPTSTCSSARRSLPDRMRAHVKALSSSPTPSRGPSRCPDDAPQLLRNLRPRRWRWSTSTTPRRSPTTGSCCDTG